MLQTNTTYLYRQSIRSRVEPFGGWSPDQRPFAVGWQTTPLTFSEIISQLKDGVLKDLRYFRKLETCHFPDLLQQGWYRLWQALHENSALLASMCRVKAVNFVSNRCGISTYKSYLTRYSSYHDFEGWQDSEDTFEDSITEIVIGSSLKSAGHTRHALFTRVVDRVLDIAGAIRKVADWCCDDIRKLAALYYVTTNVNQADAGQIAGLPIYKSKNRNPRCQGLYRWSKLVLEKLREALHEYLPIEPNRDFWKQEIKAGHLDPVVELAQKYEQDSLKLTALYCLTTGVARNTIVTELGIEDGKFWYALDQLRQELRWRYARRVPDKH